MDRISKGILTLTILMGVAACSDAVSPDQAAQPAMFAVVSWSEDVGPIDLGEIGISGVDLRNNGKYSLTPGVGRVYWTSAGVPYSQSLNIGTEDPGEDQDVQCEQEGEHEGDNEGCTLAFAFSGPNLSISPVN